MEIVEAAPKRPYIKKVVIHGFKTYGNHTDIEEFSSGMNVLGTISFVSFALPSFLVSNQYLFFRLVGMNGAGKSNFLAGTYTLAAVPWLERQFASYLTFRLSNTSVCHVI